MAGEFETTGLEIHLKDGDIVTSLIATIEVPAGGIEVEAAWIIPSCPFFPYERKLAFSANGKNPDTVMQPVARINKLPID